MTRLSTLITVALAVLTAYAGPAAAAYNRAFCVTVSVTYTDSSDTGDNWTLLGGSPEAYEDNWWTPTAAREPRGAAYELRGGVGQVLMSGYLGDGFGAQAAGCTPNYTGTAKPYSLRIKSYGSIQSNWQYTYDPYQQPDVLTFSFPRGEPSESGLPYPITLSPSGTTAPRVWSGYIAGAYALYRHAGGETLNYFQFYLCQCVKASTCPPWAGACVGGFCQTGGAVCIETCDEVGTPFEGCVCAFDDAGGCVASNNTNYSLDAGNGLQRTSVLTNTAMQRKYVIVHEMGHIMAANVTDGYANGGDCTGDDDEPCHEAGNGSHAFWSREFDRCAFKEAFADFYAADVWNQGGCDPDHGAMLTSARWNDA
jgi:hypothetical protein